MIITEYIASDIDKESPKRLKISKNRSAAFFEMRIEVQSDNKAWHSVAGIELTISEANELHTFFDLVFKNGQ